MMCTLKDSTQFAFDLYHLNFPLLIINEFLQHYKAVMKYINNGPLMLDVHMHRPQTTARNFMDSLFAFWPGLQVNS